MKVLVLCRGNVNRSAAAAAVLSRDSRLQVRSAGFLTQGRRAAAKMRRAMKARGYDLEEHRTTKCTPELLEWADTIIVMDARNESDVQELMPAGVQVQTQRLGSYLSPETSIPDPCWTKENDPKFGATVDAIVRSCKAFLEKLQ